MNKPMFLLGLVLVVLVAVGLSIGVAVAKESKEDKKLEKQEKKCDKLEKKNDKREAKGKEPKALPDYCGFQGQVFEFPELGATVTVQAPAPVTVTAVPSTDPTIIDPERDGTFGGLNKFYNFQASGPFTLAKIEVSYDSTHLVSYVDENTLRLRWWDPTINDWAQPIDSGVDTTNHVVWAIVDHFSEYAPIGDVLGEYSNNFEYGRASKSNVPLGVYIKQTYATFNADDVADAPYDILSTDTYWPDTNSNSLKFDAPLMQPDPQQNGNWLETGVFDVTGETTYTFTFYTKYLPAEGSSDFGDVYYYELDADNNFLGQTGDLFFFNADGVFSGRDYITVTSEPQADGWQLVTATLTTDSAAAHAKLGFTEYYAESLGHDTYYVDSFSYAAV
jgi:hypothetical protein